MAADGYDEKELSKLIRNYGCHCFPEYTRSTTGAGPPVDEMDSLCRDLNRCKKCIEIEQDAGSLTGECQNDDVDQGKYDYSVDAVNGIDCNPRGRNSDCK